LACVEKAMDQCGQPPPARRPGVAATSSEVVPRRARAATALHVHQGPGAASSIWPGRWLSLRRPGVADGTESLPLQWL
jgi:hypothetical protein